MKKYNRPPTRNHFECPPRRMLSVLSKVSVCLSVIGVFAVSLAQRSITFNIILLLILYHGCWSLVNQIKLCNNILQLFSFIIISHIIIIEMQNWVLKCTIYNGKSQYIMYMYLLIKGTLSYFPLPNLFQFIVDHGHITFN